MSWTTVAFNNTTFFLLTRFDSKFDMREAYCWRSNDEYKNPMNSRIDIDSDIKFCIRHSNAR